MSVDDIASAEMLWILQEKALRLHKIWKGLITRRKYYWWTHYVEITGADTVTVGGQTEQKFYMKNE